MAKPKSKTKVVPKLKPVTVKKSSPKKTEGISAKLTKLFESNPTKTFSMKAISGKYKTVNIATIRSTVQRFVKTGKVLKSTVNDQVQYGLNPSAVKQESKIAGK